MPEVDKPPQPCEPGQYLPDPQNCNAYYRCVLGELRKQYCAGGLHWNKERKVCDWPKEAKCQEHKRKYQRYHLDSSQYHLVCSWSQTNDSFVAKTHDYFLAKTHNYFLAKTHNYFLAKTHNYFLAKTYHATPVPTHHHQPLANQDD
jgi:hypothetical protein